MSGIEHKESLSGQTQIKRRRVVEGNDQPAEEDDKRAKKEEEEEKTAHPQPGTGAPHAEDSSSSSSEEENEEEADEIAKELERLQSLQNDRISGNRNPSRRHTTASHYDVLFSNADWRWRGTGEAEKKERMKKTMVNSKQDSLAYERFIKNSFK
ncbi:hypothetical protein ADEAN_000519400 [Angomonas deanei]|uniref:Uncharacterized protein n=1 Tax=Angomonas deanei TaxID=59799 RepID=A0A7G2CFQ7_9TRYP|nr:hypothetical protein ADEAN_000519400 [Angomonas deanei]